MKETCDGMPQMKIRALISTAVKILLTLVVFYYVWITVHANWAQVRGYSWDFNPALMGVSALMFWAAYAYLAWVWGKVLEYTGHGVSYRDAWDTYYIGNLGRYIPGKVWTIAGTAWIADRRGLPAAKTGTASVFAQAYSIISSFVFLAFFLIIKGAHVDGLDFRWLIPLIIVFTVVFIIPHNMEWLINRMLSALGRDSISLGLTVGKASRIVCWYFISWLLFGVAYWLFMAAVTNDSSLSLVILTAVFSAAYVGGFLAIFVPGGLGVREGLMSVMLAGTVPQAVGILTAFLVRLLVTAIELVCVLIIPLRKGFAYAKKETAAR